VRKVIRYDFSRKSKAAKSKVPGIADSISETSSEETAEQSTPVDSDVAKDQAPNASESTLQTDL